MDLDIYFDIDIEADAELIFIPLYKMTPIELKKLKKQFLDLLSKNFIRPSVFLWGAPIQFVKKKDESMCLCIDYWQLNKVTNFRVLQCFLSLTFGHAIIPVKD